MSLPRYFVPRAAAASAGAGTDGGQIGEVACPVDLFVLGGRQAAAVEWLVGFDQAGALAAQPTEPLAAMLPAARQLVAFHEVAAQGERRVVALETLFLFELRLVQQAPNCPGANDPVYLYGTLLGPLSPAGAGARGGRVEGQLTVSRGDVLAGLIAGAPWAFHHPAPEGARTARTHAFLVPGDREPAVIDGSGAAVLVYPMLDADIYALMPGNEDVVTQILYDLLASFWGDVQEESPPPLRRPDQLPVPNRELHEQRLASEGFRVEGDRAVRSRPGWLAALPGALGEERRALPAEGSLQQFLALAEEALASLPEPPPRPGSALHRRVQPASRMSPLRLPLPSPLPSAQQPGVPPAVRPPATAPRAPQSPGPPAWMQDFIASHTAPGGAPPRLTQGPRPRPQPERRAPATGSGTGTAGTGRPRWMDDFDPRAGAPPGQETGGAPRPTDDDRASTTSQAKPDWRKDFED